MHYDAIVIGLGGMGSAAAYQLARRGKRVLGLERFTIPHEMGSSHGLTRIIRLAYYEDPSYVPLLRRSYELWRELQTQTGAELLHITGSIDAGSAESEVFTGSLASCQLHGLPHEVLTGAEVNARFPGYHFLPDMMAVFQPDGGFLVPEACITAYTQAAQQHGATLHQQESVIAWEPTAQGVRLQTERGTYTAEKLVITAGAWAGKLLPFLQSYAQPERQVLVWLETSAPQLFMPNRFPVFNVVVEEGRYYGFPLYQHPGFKFGRYHHLDEAADPDALDRDANAADEAILRVFAERYFPQAAGRALMFKTCMFTNTPDEHFIIDHHPQHPQVVFAAGFSGHGFKMCSVVGEVLADLALERHTPHDIGLLRWGRFATPFAG